MNGLCAFLFYCCCSSCPFPRLRFARMGKSCGGWFAKLNIPKGKRTLRTGAQPVPWPSLRGGKMGNNLNPRADRKMKRLRHGGTESRRDSKQNSDERRVWERESESKREIQIHINTHTHISFVYGHAYEQVGKICCKRSVTERNGEIVNISSK